MRASCFSIATITKRFYRNNKTYRDWKHYFLTDDFNLSLTRHSIFEKWQKEKRKVKDENERITDISGLPKYLKDRTCKELEYHPPRRFAERTILYQRRLFALYGEKHIDPAVCWPDRSDINKLKKREILLDTPLSEHLENCEKQEVWVKEETQRRIESWDTNMEKMPALIKQYEKVVEKREADAKVMMEKKKKIKEEAREFFGFHLADGDPKLFQMQKLKEEEEAKRKKALRKEKARK